MLLAREQSLGEAHVQGRSRCIAVVWEDMQNGSDRPVAAGRERQLSGNLIVPLTRRSAFNGRQLPLQAEITQIGREQSK